MKFICRGVALTTMLVSLVILVWYPVVIIYGFVKFVIMDGMELEEYIDIVIEGFDQSIKKIYSTLWRSFVDGEWHSIEAGL